MSILINGCWVVFCVLMSSIAWSYAPNSALAWFSTALACIVIAAELFLWAGEK